MVPETYAEIAEEAERRIALAKAKGWAMKQTHDGKFYLADPNHPLLFGCGTDEAKAWERAGWLLYYGDMASLGIEDDA